MAKGLNTVSVVDALTASLRSRVLDGQIDAGVGLTETDVANDYEVSRPTAKTAISQLVQEGLLRREAHKSAHVPEPVQSRRRRSLPGPDTPGARGRPADRRDRHSAGSRRCGRRTGQRAHRGRAQRFVEADLGFHRALVGAVDSPRLNRLYQALSGEIHLSMVQSRHALGRDRIVAEHGGVLAALVRGDAELAETLMRAHLEGARDALADQFDTINPARA